MKCLVLLSSGFDSPAAAGLMKKNCEVVLLHFYNSHKSVERVKKLKKILNCSLVVIDNSVVMKKISGNNHTCVICKRSMYKLAGRVAERLGVDFLVTGENIGQVASQTLQNLKILDSAVSIPVIRPLIAYDKNEIIKLAKRIGTFEISSLPEIKCDFVPDKPVTRADLSKILEFEVRLGVDELINKCLGSLKFFK